MHRQLAWLSLRCFPLGFPWCNLGYRASTTRVVQLPAGKQNEGLDDSGQLWLLRVACKCSIMQCSSNAMFKCLISLRISGHCVLLLHWVCALC